MTAGDFISTVSKYDSTLQLQMKNDSFTSVLQKVWKCSHELGLFLFLS